MVIKNMKFETKEVRVGEDVSTAFPSVCRWIGVDPKNIAYKSQKYKNPSCNFLISANDDYLDIIALLLKMQYSNVEIIVDPKINAEQMNGIKKLKKKYPDHLNIYKSQNNIYESYFNVNSNLFFSSVRRDLHNYVIKEESRIEYPGKQMLKDFNQLFNSYKHKSYKMEEEIYCEK